MQVQGPRFRPPSILLARAMIPCSHQLDIVGCTCSSGRCLQGDRGGMKADYENRKASAIHHGSSLPQSSDDIQKSSLRRALLWALILQFFRSLEQLEVGHHGANSHCSLCGSCPPCRHLTIHRSNHRDIPRPASAYGRASPRWRRRYHGLSTMRGTLSPNTSFMLFVLHAPWPWATDVRLRPSPSLVCFHQRSFRDL